MSAESLGGGWGNQYLSEDDEIWQRMAAQFKDQMGNLDGQNASADDSEVVAETVAEEIEPEVEEINVEMPSQGDGVVSAEQHRENLGARLAAENEVRMRQSEEEMAAFELKLEMSPEAYWQELRNEYALEGVNLGLMPDVRGMREEATGFLAENFGEDQTQRVGIALKTELEKMARSKAEEIRKWQSEGRGLPITFESEWVEAGQRDMKNILNEYYGAEGDFGKQAKSGGELADEEKVAWQMASLEQKPGTLNPVWVVKSYAGRFEGETVPEYYNRLKNYRKQDQMREWQIQQDQGKQVIDRGELEDEGVAEVAENEPEVAENEEERKAREVEEAIRETDEEVEQIWREREAKERSMMVQEIVKSPSFKMAVKYLIQKFLDAMKREDTTEEDGAYYAEMERQEQQKPRRGFDAELWAVTDRSGLPPVFEDEGVVDEVQANELQADEQERQDEVTDDVEGAVRALTPERVQELAKTIREAERLLGRKDLSEKVRASVEESYGRLVAVWNRYQEVEREKEVAKDAEAQLAFDYLVRKNLISGEVGEGSAGELEVLRRETEKALNEAAWNDDGVAVSEYLERIKAIRQAMEWLGIEPNGVRGVDVIPVERSQGEVAGGVEPEVTGAVA